MALKAEYIDAYRGRFGVGPICRVLSAGLNCGFLTARGYRAFKRRPPSRIAARHEVLARDVAAIHDDEFMRGLGIRGVGGGRRPVTTIPSRGVGGRLDLVGRKFEASAPNRLHVADITYVRLADGSFAYVAFGTGAFARRFVGWTADELEYATMRWVSWYNSKRLHASLGYRTPQDVENEYYRQQTAQAVSQ